MKKIIICILATLLPIVASAYDAKIDGIYYNFSGTEATVTHDEFIDISVGCYNGNINIPENVTYNDVIYRVTSIGEGAFLFSRYLNSVTIPNSVTSIGSDAFNYCSGLTSISVENGNTKYDSRDNCNAIIETETNTLVLGCKSTTIPQNVTLIGISAFENCVDLRSITIPNSVTSIEWYAFNGCSNLEKIELNSNAIVSQSYSFGSTSLKGIFGEQIKEYVIGDEVTSIGEGAFNGCSGLNSITIGNSVKSINDYAFYGCSDLNSITIGNSVTSIGRQVFYECSNIASITVGKENTKYDSRDNCNAIIETASNQLIFGCRNTTIPQTVTSIGNGAFEGCSGLKSITIPNSVKIIDDLAFSGCSNLTSITIPNSVTSIDYGVFYNCSSLTSVTIPESVTSIASGVFSGCSGLTSIELSNKTTYIGDYAFSGCSALTSVEIPNSVTYVGDYAFKNCSGLRDVYCFAENVPTTATNAFEMDITNTTLYIPRVSAEIYKATLPWSEFENFVLLSDGEVEINETNFPDENFRSYLLKQSYGSDGILTNAEIASVTSIQLDSYYSSAAKIKSLQGIEYFTELNSLDCYGNQLTSLDLSKNTKLTSLGCSSNQLTSIDLSKNTNLTNLSCSFNQLTSLDISKNTSLTYLYCPHNQLTSLDLSQNTALTSLDCFSNQLTSLDLSKNVKLTSLDCYNNRIKGEAMDALVASLPTITSASSYDGRMEVINNSSERNMMTIDQVAAAKAKGWTPLYNAGSGYSDYWQEYAGLDPTKIIEINETTFPDESFRNWLLTQSYGEDGLLTDTEILTTTTMYVYSYYGSSIQSLKGIEYFTELTSLSCTNHSLTTIDLSKNTKLTNLECYSNQISGEGMDALIASLPVVSNGTLRIHWYNNEGNEMSTAQAAAAKSKGWIPQAYTINEGSYNYSWVEYTGTDVDPSLIEKFPDAAFRNYLLSQSYGMDGVITDEEIATVTRIDVPYKKIKSLKGIEYFTALEMLDCGSNQLTDLDLSKNTSLTFLNCYSNQLTSLDLSKNTLLSDLDCSNNQLTSLNMAGCKLMEEFGCSNNRLTSLDLSGFDMLKGFSCDDNQLTSLNLSGCTSLDRLTCYNNQLKGTSMDALIASLPTVSIGTMRVLSRNEIYKMLGYEDGNGYSNEMTLEQVIAAKAKGWIPYYSIYGTSSSDWVEYIPNDPSGVGIAINETNFPDENFRNNLLSTSYGYDGVLTELEASLVNTMDVAYGTLQSLKGIEYFTELKSLNCGDNQIATMDLSKNTKLTSLDCHSNQLTSLDVSKCTELTRLECGYNQIATLDLSDNTKLNTVYCYGNNMATLDVSKCTELTRLECMENQLTTLDVSNMPMLVGLYCSENLLTSLDVSKSTLLQRLECYSNQLTSLDVSNNTALTNLECEDNQLTALDVSNNTMLKGLRIYKNQIKGKAMDILVAGLPMVDGRSMRAIYNEGEGNEMTRKQVYAAWEKGWIPERYGLIETDYGSYYSWEEYYGSDDDILRGDVNGDGEVNVGDLVSVSNYMAGDESVSEDAADVNQDGEVNVGDMVVISNIMSGNE